MSHPQQRPPRPQPAVLAVLVGSAMILGSWVAVSGKAHLSDQVGWINVGVAGLVVAVAGVSAYLVEFRREVRRRHATVREALGR